MISGIHYRGCGPCGIGVLPDSKAGPRPQPKEEELRLSAQARLVDHPGSSYESDSKNVLDIFHQTHPAIASDTFDCMTVGGPSPPDASSLTWRSALARVERLEKQAFTRQSCDGLCSIFQY